MLVYVSFGFHTVQDFTTFLFWKELTIEEMEDTQNCFYISCS